MKIMVAYDGSLQSKEALVYGMRKAREKGGEVLALHVFNSNMFIDYDVIGAEEAARRETAKRLDEAKTLIHEHANGVPASLFTTEGNPEEEIISFAKARMADLLLCPSSFKGIIAKYRRAAAEPEWTGVSNLTIFSTKAM